MRQFSQPGKGRLVIEPLGAAHAATFGTLPTGAMIDAALARVGD